MASGKEKISVKDGYFLFRNLRYWGRPSHLTLEVTNRCNLRCSHCFQSHFSFPRGDLRPEVWEAVKKDIPQVKGVSLSSAGEPLLARDFEKYLSFCEAQGIPVGITTNAQLLEPFLERLVGRLSQLNVSLDALSEEGYRRRRGASPAPVIRALRGLKALKEARGTKLPHLSFIVVLNRENVGELLDIIRFATEVGAQQVYAYHQLFYEEEEFQAKSLFLAQEEFDTVLREALYLAQKLGLELIHPGSFDGEIAPHPATEAYLSREKPSFFCRWIFETTTVSWNGFVQACCFCDRLFMGKLPKESLEEVWNGPAYRYLRLSFLAGRLPKECANCQFLQVVTHRKEAFLCPHREEDLYQESALLRPEGLPLREAEALYQEGLFLLEAAGPEKAFEVFLRLAEREPLYFEALNAAAVCLALLGKPHRAREFLEKALSLFPGEEILSHNLRQLALTG